MTDDEILASCFKRIRKARRPLTEETYSLLCEELDRLADTAEFPDQVKDLYAQELLNASPSEVVSNS